MSRAHLLLLHWHHEPLSQPSPKTSTFRFLSLRWDGATEILDILCCRVNVYVLLKSCMETGAAEWCDCEGWPWEDCQVTSTEPLWRPHQCDSIIREETQRALLSPVLWGRRKKIAVSLEVAICGPQQTPKLASWLWTSWISRDSELHDLYYCVTGTDTLCWVPEVEMHVYHASSVSSLQWYAHVSFVRTKPALDS